MGRFGAGQVMATAGSMLQLLRCNDESNLRQYQCSAQQPRGNHNTPYIDNISTSLQHPNYSKFSNNSKVEDSVCPDWLVVPCVHSVCMLHTQKTQIAYP